MIGTHNVRGLRDQSKRASVFQWAQEKHFDDGRVILAVVKHGSMLLTLASAYAPKVCNEIIICIKNLQFLAQELSPEPDNIIIGGDLNTIDNPSD